MCFGGSTERWMRTAVVMAWVASGALLSLAWYLSVISTFSLEYVSTVLYSPTKRHAVYQLTGKFRPRKSD
jgi:hypothetical protein